MRVDHPDYQEMALNATVERAHFLGIDFSKDGSDVWWFTTHSNIVTPDPSQTIQNCLKTHSNRSADLHVLDFRTTIGGETFELIDHGRAITDLLRTKRGEQKSIVNRKCWIYQGFVGLAMDAYRLDNTLYADIDEITAGSYRVKCQDGQRFLSEELFRVNSTILSADLAFDADVVLVKENTKFQSYWHGPSYSESSSRNLICGHLIIEDGDQYEIITWQQKIAGEFQQCIRGAFGTTPLDFQALEEDGSSRDIEVRELVYLELPAMKLEYALLTKRLYGDIVSSQQQYLPDNWCLEFEDDEISTSHFTSLSPDLWDIENDSAGRVLTFFGIENRHAQTFFAEQIHPLVNACFLPTGNGELGALKLPKVIATSPYSVILDHRNVVAIQNVKVGSREVINFIDVHYGWDFRADDYARHRVLYDEASQQEFTESDLKHVYFDGLHPSRYSGEIVRGIFDWWYDRRAAPPLRFWLTLRPSMDFLEIGDLVRVKFSRLKDYTSTDTIDRTMQIVSTRKSRKSGEFKVLVEGSTQNVDTIDSYGYQLGDGFAIPDEEYEVGLDLFALANAGTDPQIVLNGTLSNVAGTYFLDGELILTGLDTLWDSSTVGYNYDAFFHLLGDLYRDPGASQAVIRFENNFVLMIRGYLDPQIDLDLRGGGHIGTDARRYATVDNAPINEGYDHYNDVFEIPDDSPTYPAPDPLYPKAVGGYLHAVLRPQNGIKCFTDWVAGDHFFSRGVGSSESIQAQTNLSSLPPLALDLDPDSANFLWGIPKDLCGGGGAAGGNLHYLNGTTTLLGARGGDGGRGGAGGVIVCRGSGDSLSRSIDISGTDSGTNQTSYTPYVGGPIFWGGAGSGGAPGCLYFQIDGLASAYPSINGTIIDAYYGESLHKGEPILKTLWGSGEYRNNKADLVGIAEVSGELLGTTQAPLENVWDSHVRVQRLFAPVAEAPRNDYIDASAATAVLTPLWGVPGGSGSNGALSTIEVTVTPPSDDNYSYSKVRWRYLGDSVWNSDVVPAADETSFQVDADGSTIEVQLLSVSIAGRVALSGPIYTLALLDFTANPAAFRTPSNVTGLRVFGTNSTTAWGEHDLRVVCDYNNSAGSGNFFDFWIDHIEFKFTAVNDGHVMATIRTLSVFASLPLDAQFDGSGNPATNILVEAVQVSSEGESSSVVASMTLNKALPATPAGVSVGVNGIGVTIRWQNPDIQSFSHTDVHIGTTSSFSVAEANKVYGGSGTAITVGDLPAGSPLYVRLVAYDSSGQASSPTAAISFVPAPEGDEGTTTYFSATAPTGPLVSGDRWVNESAKQYSVYNGSAWVLVGNVDVYWSALLGDKPKTYATAGDNLIFDPTFNEKVQGDSGYWSNHGQATYDYIGEYGGAALRIDANGVISDIYTSWPDGIFPYTPGTTLYVACRVFVSSDFNGQLQLGTTGVDADHNTVSVYPSKPWNYSDITLGSWITLKGTINTSNALVAYLHPRLSVRPDATQGYVIFDNVYYGFVEPGATFGSDFTANVTNIPYQYIVANDDATSLGFNPAFEAWIGTVPDGWSSYSGAITKGASLDAGNGSNSVQYSPNFANSGIYLSKSVRLPASSLIVGSVDMKLDTITVVTGAPGIVVDLFTNAGLSSMVRTVVAADTTTTDLQRLRFVASAGGLPIYGIRIWLMGCWLETVQTPNLGGGWDGTVRFGSFRFAVIDPQLDNQQISVNADGTINNAGGGQVTISGLGYTGDLDATNNVLNTSKYASGELLPVDNQARLVDFVKDTGDNGGNNYYYKIAEITLTSSYDSAKIAGSFSHGASARYQREMAVDFALVTNAAVDSVTLSGFDIYGDNTGSPLRIYHEDNGATSQVVKVYLVLNNYAGVQGTLKLFATNPSTIHVWQTGTSEGTAEPSGTRLLPTVNRNVEDGAQVNVNAIWGSTLDGIPDRLSDTFDVNALNFTDEYFAYVDGSGTPRNYFRNNGDFQHWYDASNYIRSVGFGIEIEMPNFSVNASGDVSISGSLTIPSGKSIKIGRASFSSTAPGIYLGVDLGDPKFSMGDGADKEISFDSNTGDFKVGKKVTLAGTLSPYSQDTLLNYNRFYADDIDIVETGSAATCVLHGDGYIQSYLITSGSSGTSILARATLQLPEYTMGGSVNVFEGDWVWACFAYAYAGDVETSVQLLMGTTSGGTYGGTRLGFEIIGNTLYALCADDDTGETRVNVATITSGNRFGFMLIERNSDGVHFYRDGVFLTTITTNIPTTTGLAIRRTPLTLETVKETSNIKTGNSRADVYAFRYMKKGV